MLPDSSLLAYYLLVKFRSIVEGMYVYPERMIENLDASFGLVFSQPVLLGLVEAGRTRDEAYRIVQRCAMQTWNERRPFLTVLSEDEQASAALSEEQLARCFDLTKALANAQHSVDALAELEHNPLEQVPNASAARTGRA